MHLIKRKYKNLLVIGLLALTTATCKKNDDGDDSLQVITNEGMAIDGALTLTFDNVVGDKDLVLTDQTYMNKTGEEYGINEFKYIISSIALSQSDGTVFTYPVADSYFVIDEKENTSLQLNLTGIPAGRYESLQFGFGVDQSNYPIEQGTLNFVPTAEEKGMLWAWAAGYKFLKMEGDFKTSGAETSEPFTYHVGSLSDTLDNFKLISLSLSSETTSNETATNTINITTDVAQIFDAVNTMSLKVKPDVQIDPENSPKIAENVSQMFKIKK